MYTPKMTWNQIELEFVKILKKWKMHGIRFFNSTVIPYNFCGITWNYMELKSLIPL